MILLKNFEILFFYKKILKTFYLMKNMQAKWNYKIPKIMIIIL